MQIADYIASLTGKTIEELFFSNPVLVQVEQNAEGVMTISHWDESLTVAQPTDAEIVTAIAAPEPVIVPKSVSARQFKLCLLADNLLDKVDTWIATQPKGAQISYEYSGSFDRSDPTTAAVFTSLNFTDAQIDDFYVAAAKL